MIGSFALMSLIWGTSWLAMKLGVAAVPPIFFAGTRFLVAGLLLLLLAKFRGETRRLDRRELGRLLLVQLLIVVLTYAPLFWGILHGDCPESGEIKPPSQVAEVVRCPD